MSDLIEELLKSENILLIPVDGKTANVQMTAGTRWLAWDRPRKEWVVKEQSLLAPWASTTLYRGVFLIAAIEALREQT